jgi:hypothetical protein
MPMPKNGECLAHPPRAEVIMTADTMGKPFPQVIAVFPPRPVGTKACGEFASDMTAHLAMIDKERTAAAFAYSEHSHLPATMTGIPSTQVIIDERG